MTGKAVVVRGGWAGHDPVGTTELFIPFLRRRGFDVAVHDDPSAYDDHETLRDVALVVQCVTMGELSGRGASALRRAVREGAGLAGWHGGVIDSFRASTDYLQLVGGQFAAHPPVDEDAAHADHRIPHVVTMTPEGLVHPITAGLGDFEIVTENYWVLHDGYGSVLATTEVPVRDRSPWNTPIASPAVWIRRWGLGRVFVATPGHDRRVLEHPPVRTIVERGLLWAAGRGEDVA